MSDKQLILHCYSDLFRSANAYYLNPKGTVHLVFLKHARKVLQSMKSNTTVFWLSKLEKIRNSIKDDVCDKENVAKRADEILTLGILLKNSRF